MNEQSKSESNNKTYHQQIQDTYKKEQERREQELKEEREDRRLAEKEYQNKLDELQEKI